MCLIGFGFQHLPGIPVVVLANRDEFRARPALPPALRTHASTRVSWLGGLDGREGGTWLGVNQFGLLVAVTNRRRRSVPRARRSRGLLCVDLLSHSTPADALEAALRELRDDRYDGCNLLLVSQAAAALVTATDEIQHHWLPSGLHVLSNGPLDDPGDRRAARFKRLLGELDLTKQDGSNWFDTGAKLLGLGAEGSEPELALSGETHGTVSATCVALAHGVGSSIYRHAAGLPHATPFDDYSPLLRDLLQSPPPSMPTS